MFVPLIATFGRAKKEWFGRYLELPEGEHPVPSDDTYRRAISRLDPETFEVASHQWVASLASRIPGEVIALDKGIFGFTLLTLSRSFLCCFQCNTFSLGRPIPIVELKKVPIMLLDKRSHGA